jgi:predicted nucleotidyltransferase
MNNEEKVLNILFKNPTAKFHLRELARMSKLNPNTILNITKKLEKRGLLLKEKKKHLTEIYANIENKRFILEKKLFNLKQIYDSGIIDFLTNKYKPESISLIGSYATGEDIEKSDIDIVIITKFKEDSNMTKYEKTFNRKAHLITTDYKEMSNEFYINLINGVLLYGYIDKK